MRKILFVMTSLYNGGAERSLTNLLLELPKDEYEIDLLLFKKRGLFLSQLPSNVNVLNTPLSLFKLYGSLKNAGLLLPYKLYSNTVSRLSTKDDEEMRAYRWHNYYSKNVEKLDKHYDVAVAYISGEVLYYLDEKVDADKKYVWVHNDYKSANYPQEYDYPHFKNMDGIVSISTQCVDILKELFPEFKEKIYMLENITSSINIKSRSMEYYPNEYSKDTINLLSIGRLHEQKGFDFAIDSAALLKSYGISFKWFVIGDGELKESLENQIKEKNVEDCFVLLGVKENPYVYIQNCDILVQTSRFEGKSVVLDETKILAKPILATRYPTVHDQLADGLEGIIVDMNAGSIANGLKELITHKEKREEISEYLSQRNYGNVEEIEKYKELFNK